MSSTLSSEYQWDDRNYEPFDSASQVRKGRLRISHASDTVSWVVDGKEGWTMSLPEYEALLEAIDELTRRSRP